MPAVFSGSFTEVNVLLTFTALCVQGLKLRLPGRQCDEKFSPGDQNFIAGRQLATCKAGCYCGL